MANLIRKSEVSSPLFNTFFDDFFNKNLFDWNTRRLSAFANPSANIKETDKAFEIQIAAPGLKKDDFNIQLDHNVLTISSEKEEEKTEKDKNDDYVRREFNYQSFSRSFTLPETVNADKIEASYTDGLLKITIPKKNGAGSQPVKTISIK